MLVALLRPLVVTWRPGGDRRHLLGMACGHDFLFICWILFLTRAGLSRFPRRSRNQLLIVLHACAKVALVFVIQPVVRPHHVAEQVFLHWKSSHIAI